MGAGVPARGHVAHGFHHTRGRPSVAVHARNAGASRIGSALGAATLLTALTAWADESANGKAVAAETKASSPEPTTKRWEGLAEAACPSDILLTRGFCVDRYVFYYVAKRACESAGKRLCSRDEWVTACRVAQAQYPYGNELRRMSCNVYRYLHPAHVLLGLSQMHQLDPRFNLLSVGGEPLLNDTGAMPNCKSPGWNGEAAHDRVGNLDEWIENEAGELRGGFYARATTQGCDAQV